MKNFAYATVLALCVSLSTPILFAQHALVVSAVAPANPKAVISTTIVSPGAVSIPRIGSSMVGRSIHVSLVNWSAQNRQLALKSGGRLDLPTGKRVDIDSYVGSTLLIVSDIRSIDERIVIETGDEKRLLSVR